MRAWTDQGSHAFEQRPSQSGVLLPAGHGMSAPIRSRLLRQHLENQVLAAQASSRQAEQRASQFLRMAALGRLTGRVAHDFNNLLGVISNGAHLIERHVAQNPALQMPLEVTLRAVATGSHLLQQLLRVSAGQAGIPRWVDLADYLPELRDILQLLLRKDVQVGIAVAPGTALFKTDPGALELTLINLALNGRDAMSGSGQLQVHARNAAPADVEDMPEGNYVLITVSDTGAGLAEDEAARIFEPAIANHHLGQSDLGLSQVHAFCVHAGGKARIASTPGFGSTVSLLLPACARPQANSG